jgi:hypothetical protein
MPLFIVTSTRTELSKQPARFDKHLQYMTINTPLKSLSFCFCFCFCCQEPQAVSTETGNSDPCTDIWNSHNLAQSPSPSSRQRVASSYTVSSLSSILTFEPRSLGLKSSRRARGSSYPWCAIMEAHGRFDGPSCLGRIEGEKEDVDGARSVGRDLSDGELPVPDFEGYRYVFPRSPCPSAEPNSTTFDLPPPEPHRPFIRTYANILESPTRVGVLRPDFTSYRNDRRDTSSLPGSPRCSSSLDPHSFARPHRNMFTTYRKHQP